MEELISETIPKNIRLKKELDLDDELSENEFLTHIDKLSKKIKIINPTLGLDIINLLLPQLLKEIF